MVERFKSEDFYGGFVDSFESRKYKGMIYKIPEEFFYIYDDLVSCEYVPQEIANKIRREKESPKSKDDLYTKIIYSGDLYNLSIIDDYYDLCIRLVEDFFPENEKELYIKSFEIMREGDCDEER